MDRKRTKERLKSEELIRNKMNIKGSIKGYAEIIQMVERLPCMWLIWA